MPLIESKKKTHKNMLLFDYLKNILQTKSMQTYDNHIHSDNFNSSFSTFMVLRYLSMCENPEVRNIVLENQLQLERFPDSKMLYLHLLKIIPKQNTSFIVYLK